MNPDVNLNLYRVFYICAKSNSFVEASEKLYISQPAISKNIKNLEKILNVKLFYRDKRGLKLTNSGKLLYRYVDEFYNGLIAGQKKIIEDNNIDCGSIIIGAPAHVASFYLLEYIENYRNDHPNVFFRIINGSTNKLLKDLEEHKIDFIIDSSPIDLNNKSMHMESLTSFETCFITFLDNENEKLEDQVFIMPYERSSIRRNLVRELSKYNISLKEILEVETTDLIISSVKRRIGSGYVVKKAVQSELEKKELKELKFEHDLPKLELNLVYIEDYLTNISKHFINHYIKK